MYDTRLGRFLSVDPMTDQFAWWTPYQFAGNSPIWAKDLDGDESDEDTDGANQGTGATDPYQSTGVDVTVSASYPSGSAYGVASQEPAYTTGSQTFANIFGSEQTQDGSNQIAPPMAPQAASGSLPQTASSQQPIDDINAGVPKPRIRIGGNGQEDILDQVMYFVFRGWDPVNHDLVMQPYGRNFTGNEGLNGGTRSMLNRGAYNEDSQVDLGPLVGHAPGFGENYTDKSTNEFVRKLAKASDFIYSISERVEESRTQLKVPNANTTSTQPTTVNFLTLLFILIILVTA
jgi:hypothetical protein